MYTYRLDKVSQRILRSRAHIARAIVQTKEDMLLCESADDNDTEFHLVHLNDRLEETGRRLLYRFSDVPVGDAEPWGYHVNLKMTQFHLFAFYCPPWEGDCWAIAKNIALLQVDLSSGEIRKWKWEVLKPDHRIVNEMSLIGAYGNRAYFDAVLVDEEGKEFRVTLVFDTDTGSFTVLSDQPMADWRSGKPVSFDFEKGIMWTFLTKEERERKQPEQAEYWLAAREIRPDAPILTEYPLWKLSQFPNWQEHIQYFDGKRFYAGGDEVFYALGSQGERSQDWTFPACKDSAAPNTAFVWTALVWDDRLIVELGRDQRSSRWRSYPAVFAGADEEQGIWLDVEDVKNED